MYSVKQIYAIKEEKRFSAYYPRCPPVLIEVEPQKELAKPFHVMNDQLWQLFSFMYLFYFFCYWFVAFSVRFYFPLLFLFLSIFLICYLFFQPVEFFCQYSFSRYAVTHYSLHYTVSNTLGKGNTFISNWLAKRAAKTCGRFQSYIGLSYVSALKFRQLKLWKCGHFHFH